MQKASGRLPTGWNPNRVVEAKRTGRMFVQVLLPVSTWAAERLKIPGKTSGWQVFFFGVLPQTLPRCLM